MRKSRTLRKLRQGEPVLVISPSLTHTPRTVEIAGLIGFDCAWLDTEHSDFSTDDLYPSLMAARLHDMDAMVRIRKAGYSDYFRPLEQGATGIMVPHVMSADEARRAVRNAKFAPAGLRGIDAAGPDADFMTVEPKSYAEEANRETFVVCQVEDREALDCIDEIMSVPGVDVIFVGPADLSQSLGVAFQFESQVLQRAVEKVAEAARRHGKSWGIPAGTPAAFERYTSMGARFMGVGSDLGSLLAEWKERYAQFAELARKVAPAGD